MELVSQLISRGFMGEYFATENKGEAQRQRQAREPADSPNSQVHAVYAPLVARHEAYQQSACLILLILRQSGCRSFDFFPSTRGVPFLPPPSLVAL